jgi:hypothetical protein
MKKILYPVFTAILIAVMLVSPAGAGGYKLSSAFTLSSLLANGTATGLGKTDWLISLDASGSGAVVCVNNGTNPVPGQSSPHIDGSATQKLAAGDPLRKNGKSPFSMEAIPPEEAPGYTLDWQQGGCPNSNWTAFVDFVFWDHAVISLKDPLTLETVATFKYVCVTTRTGPRGDPNSTFDDGIVSCTEYFG